MIQKIPDAQQRPWEPSTIYISFDFSGVDPVLFVKSARAYRRWKRRQEKRGLRSEYTKRNGKSTYIRAEK